MTSSIIKEHAKKTIDLLGEDEIPIVITVDKFTQHYTIYDSYLEDDYLYELIKHIAEEIRTGKINTLQKEKELLNE